MKPQKTISVVSFVGLAISTSLSLAAQNSTPDSFDLGSWAGMSDSHRLLAQSKTDLRNMPAKTDFHYWRGLLLLPEESAQITPEIVAASVNLAGSQLTSSVTTVTLLPHYMSFFRVFSFYRGPHCVVSPPQSAVLTNTGTRALTISSITISGLFSRTNECITVVKPNTSCTITVASRPVPFRDHNLTLNGRLDVNDNGVGSPQVVYLSLHVGNIGC